MIVKIKKIIGKFFSSNNILAKTGFLLLILAMMIPDIKGNKSIDHPGDTIIFSGHKWLTKESAGKHTGPGNNYFSGSKENVYLDGEGKLHLRVTNRDDKWFCPEVRLLESLGYGQYYFYLDPLPQPLDKDVVIGLFLYDRDDTSNFHKEIDIEFSQWGKDTTDNTQYVIQPKENDARRFDTDLAMRTGHMIELRRKKIRFKSFYANGELENKEVTFMKYKVKPDYEYDTENEKISMNVWLYHTIEPASLKEFEVIISRFEFKPFWYDKILHRK